MKGMVFYQDIDSGSKVATEALLRALAVDQPQAEFIVYKQNPRFHQGQFSFLKNLIWSISDFRHQLNSQPELDVVYSAMYTSAWAQLFSKHRRVPLVLHLHGDQRFGRYRSELSWRVLDPRFWYASLIGKSVLLLQMWAVLFARTVIFVSRTARDEFLRRYYLGKVVTKTQILINGVDLHHYQPATRTQQHRLLKKYHLQAPTIVYVGRMDEKKGVHHLLQALAFLPTFSLSLVIAYPKPNDKYAQQYLHQLKQQARRVASRHHHVHFWQTPAQLRELYQLATAVILPSQQEMMPLVMLEALASGAPFLVPAVGGVLEILSPLKQLAILKNTEPHYLAQRIKEVCSLSPGVRQRWQDQERHIASQYLWENQAKKLFQILQKATRR